MNINEFHDLLESHYISGERLRQMIVEIEQENTRLSVRCAEMDNELSVVRNELEEACGYNATLAQELDSMRHEILKNKSLAID